MDWAGDHPYRRTGHIVGREEDGCRAGRGTERQGPRTPGRRQVVLEGAAMKIVDILKTGEKEFVKHSPEILTGIGIAGTVTTVIFAVRATPKAIELIDDKAHDKTQDCVATDIHDDYYGWGLQYLPPFEIVKSTWKLYIPAMAMGTISIACFIGAGRIQNNRVTAIAGLYSLAEKTLDDYRQNVIKRFDKETDKDIYREVEQKQAKELTLPNPKDAYIIPGNGPTLCYDPIIGRYFRSDKESIREAVNNFNKDLIDGVFGELNSLYMHMNLPTIAIGEFLGWSNANLLDMDFTAREAPNGELCLVMMFNSLPTETYRSSY